MEEDLTLLEKCQLSKWKGKVMLAVPIILQGKEYLKLSDLVMSLYLVSLLYHFQDCSERIKLVQVQSLHVKIRYLKGYTPLPLKLLWAFLIVVKLI